MQTFEPDQLVLVHFFNGGPWRLRRYSILFKGYGHETQDGNIWADECIIPYAGNEHLLGTTNSPGPKWEPKEGEVVAVSDDGKNWEPCIYRGRSEDDKMPYRASRMALGLRNTCDWKYCEPFRKHFTIPAEQHECPTPEVSCHARDGKLCMSDNHLACAQAADKDSFIMRRFKEVK